MNLTFYEIEDRLEEAVVARKAAITPKGYTRGRAHEDFWRRRLEEAALNAQARKNVSKGDFVFPDKAPGSGSYPIPDRAHGANALARSAGKPEHDAVRRKVCSRYSDLPTCKES